MARAATACSIPGCPELATQRNRCDEHQRPPSPGRGSTRRWRLIRQGILDRDGYQCTHVDEDGARCPEVDDLHVDHVIPVALGGSDRPENLRTLCARHNLAKGAKPHP